jgi:transcription-repair coupling factor (superfamily II helicase)
VEQLGVKSNKIRRSVGIFGIIHYRALFKSGASFLVVLNDKEEAAYYLNDLEQMIGEQDVLFYPGSYRRPYQIEDTDNANVLLRAEVLTE